VASKEAFETVLCGATNHLSAAMVPLGAAKTADRSELPSLLAEASDELAASLALLERGRNWGDGGRAEARARVTEMLARLNVAFWGSDVPVYRSTSTVGKVLEAATLYGQHVTELYSQSLSDGPATKREAADAGDLVSLVVSSGVLLLVAQGLGLELSIPWGEEVGYQLPCEEGS
jgi:hypothetical protein